MLTAEIIRRVREIQIRTGRSVADVLAGEFISVFRGTGMEFDEVRPYQAGDDIRTIDWNVTARAGAPFVKRFVEERQLTLLLMADISASQDFGSLTQSKREAAAEFCALVAFSASHNDDKVGSCYSTVRWSNTSHRETANVTPNGSSETSSPTVRHNTRTKKTHRGGSAGYHRGASARACAICHPYRQSARIHHVGEQKAHRLFCGKRFYRRPV